MGSSSRSGGGKSFSSGIASSGSASSNQAIPVLAQLHSMSSTLSHSPVYSRLLWSDRHKRGLFSNLAMLSELASGVGGGGGGGSAASQLASALSGGSKDPDADETSATSSVSKPIPYKFTSTEMTAIQAMVSLRDIISELLQKVGFNIPGIASFITRSEAGVDKTAAAAAASNNGYGILAAETSSSNSNPFSAFTSSKSTNVGVQVLRGLALLSPLIIPMASQLRRMSPDSSSSHFASSSSLPSLPMPMVPPMPMLIPDIYYNQAMHRRRGKRSAGELQQQQLQMHPLLNSAALHRYLQALEHSSGYGKVLPKKK